MKAIVCSIALLSAPSAFAQAYAPPRTPEGAPDLQGYWLTGFLTPLERPDKLPDLVVPAEKKDETLKLIKEMNSEGDVYDPELDQNPIPPALLDMGGELRSSQIVEPGDGKLPLTALAKAVLDQFEFNYDDPEGRPSTERCMDGMVNAPLAGVSFLIPLQIVQTSSAVVLVMEDMDPVRIVALAPTPIASAESASPPTRGGQSRGRWDGDTLVVETTKLTVPDKAGLTFRGGAPVTSDSRIVERFRLTSPDTMLYQFTVEDPSLYAKPWRAEYVMTRTKHAVIEYACHEGNRSMANILTAARLGRQTKKKPDETKTQAAASQ